MRILHTAAAALTVCAAIGARAADRDTALGGRVFEKCSACHSLVAGQHMITWNEIMLGAIPKNPQGFIPGTVMPFGGIQNASKRAALVCCLMNH